MRTNLKTLAIGCGLVVIVALAGLGLGASGSSPRITETDVDGSYTSVTLKRLVRLSPVVVRGTPVSDELRRFADSSTLSREAKAEAAEAGLEEYHDVRVRVAEYLKGRGPRSISVVRRAHSRAAQEATVPGGIPEPRLGEEQVLFLFEGRGPWAVGFLVNGPEAVADVDGQRVEFPFPFEDGTRSVDLDGLRRLMDTR